MLYFFITLAIIFLAVFISTIPMIVKQVRINNGKSVAYKGKRFSKLVPYRGDKEELAKKIDTYLTDCGFIKCNYGKEDAYRRGDGIWAASQFFKYSFNDDSVLIEAFVILYGIKESGVEGFTGFVVKKPLKKTAETIIQLIELNNAELMKKQGLIIK